MISCEICRRVCKRRECLHSIWARTDFRENPEIDCLSFLWSYVWSHRPRNSKNLLLVVQHTRKRVNQWKGAPFFPSTNAAREIPRLDAAKPGETCQIASRPTNRLCCYCTADTEKQSRPGVEWLVSVPPAVRQRSFSCGTRELREKKLRNS